MRTDVEFPTYDGRYVLRGWAFEPDGAADAGPAVVLSGGYGDSAERLVPTAQALVEQGVGVLLYEHRNTGISGGEPRLEIDPVAQMRDMRMAVTFAQSYAGFDADRIGLFGTSFSGGHVLAVAADDRRVRAVVSVNPWISGFDVVLRAGGLPALAGFGALVEQEWRTVLAGGPPALAALGRRTDDPSSDFALFRDDAAMDYYEHGPVGVPDSWRNQFTVRSLAYALDHDVRGYAERVSPTPLLMVISRADHTMPADVSLAFHRAALEPKALALVDGGHYDTYDPKRTLPDVVEAAAPWFRTHL